MPSISISFLLIIKKTFYNMPAINECKRDGSANQMAGYAGGLVGAAVGGYICGANCALAGASVGLAAGAGVAHQFGSFSHHGCKHN